MTENATASRLQVTKFKLNALLEVTLAINENPSQEKLIMHYEGLLRNELKIGKIILYKYAGTWECILQSGLKESEIQIDVARDLLHYEDISFIPSNIDSPVRAFDIVIPVIRNNKHLAIALIGDIDEESEGVSPVIKHLNFIQTLSNIIVVAIENIRLQVENIRQVAIKKELELASKLQAMLIPDPGKLPSGGALAVSAFYHPHMDVGGDYYDFIELGPEEYGFCICDVSGKGISAAIIMSNFQANLRALFDSEIPLEELVTRLNDRVNESTMGERFLTMFVGKYKVRTRELLYVNAGHNAPLLYNKNSKTLTTLDSHCVGIGMLDDMPALVTRKLLLEKDVKLLCFTDGLVEILNDDLVEEGTGVIESFLTNAAPIGSNIDAIVRHHCILEGNDSIFDDITILGFEFN
jgi:phosphoserine phosphatase RsbU/P